MIEHLRRLSNFKIIEWKQTNENRNPAESILTARKLFTPEEAKIKIYQEDNVTNWSILSANPDEDEEEEEEDGDDGCSRYSANLTEVCRTKLSIFFPSPNL